jgi:hypothetical protein
MAARHRDSSNGAATARPAAGLRVAPALLPAAGLRVALRLAAFLCELAMLAVLAGGGWALGNGGLLSIALAIFYPSFAVLIWSLWIAPASVHRLADPPRLIAQVLLFAAAGTVAGLGGHRLIGIAFAVVASLAFAATRLGAGESADDIADTRSGSGSDTRSGSGGDTRSGSGGDVAQAGSSSS